MEKVMVEALCIPGRRVWTFQDYKILKTLHFSRLGETVHLRGYSRTALKRVVSRMGERGMIVGSPLFSWEV